jgi:hypothetical protein
MIQGLLGSEGFELRATLEGDTLNGRVGGALMKRDIKLALTETGVHGTAGAHQVQLELEGGELKGHIGADTVSLRGVDQISGELGQGLAATHLRALQRGDSLEGRIGALNGKSFTVNLDGVPGWIGALLTLAAYCALERAPTKA